MTTFLDFALAHGTPRVTVVKNAKARYQEAYTSDKDFYRPLRAFIIAAAKQNLNGMDTLASVRSALGNRNAYKLKIYEACITGYNKWHRQKPIIWCDALGSKSPVWTRGRLVIRVEPELRVSINKTPHLIKLYCEEDRPSKPRLATMFHLLKQSHRTEQLQVAVGILDIRRGRLHRPTREIHGLEELLTGEAAAFQKMWDKV